MHQGKRTSAAKWNDNGQMKEKKKKKKQQHQTKKHGEKHTPIEN